MDPFIEAEEVAGRSIKHCCDLFEVSRAALTSAAGAKGGFRIGLRVLASFELPMSIRSI
jgi:hypothetical protein